MNTIKLLENIISKENINLLLETNKPVKPFVKPPVKMTVKKNNSGSKNAQLTKMSIKKSKQATLLKDANKQLIKIFFNKLLDNFISWKKENGNNEKSFIDFINYIKKFKRCRYF